MRRVEGQQPLVVLLGSRMISFEGRDLTGASGIAIMSSGCFSSASHTHERASASRRVNSSLLSSGRIRILIATSRLSRVSKAR
jgi:hypothetical protein